LEGEIESISKISKKLTVKTLPPQLPSTIRTHYPETQSPTIQTHHNFPHNAFIPKTNIQIIDKRISSFNYHTEKIN
jgi:hypothetical protein